MQARLLYREIVVDDLTESRDFYRGALGFEAGAPIEAPALEIDGGVFRVRMVDMRRPDATIRLTQLVEPRASGARTHAPQNRYGLTHLALYVDDLDRAADLLGASGGTVLAHTRARFDDADATMMFCTDPDGTRVELMHAPTAAAGFSHSGICSRDLRRTLEFYEVLGFLPAEAFELTEHRFLDTLNELEGVSMSVQMLRNAVDDTIEILSIHSPPCHEALEPRRANSYGFNAIGFGVNDPAAIAALLAARDGVVGEAAAGPDGGEVLRVVDPNGVRVALHQL